MQLMPIGLRSACSSLVIRGWMSRTPDTTSLAGAFQTPRCSSLRDQIPAMWPEGGMAIFLGPEPGIGLGTVIHG
jgi:hypothetical protein